MINEAKETNVLISKQTRNMFILIVSIIVITISNGILGAFKSGKFYKTYDYVEVNIPYEEVNYDDPIFKDWTPQSKEVIKYETEYLYDETIHENIKIKVKMYKGYNSNYFYKSFWFYAETLANTVTVLLFYITLVNFLISKRVNEDEVYIKLESELNELIYEKNALPSYTFEPFIEKWNRDRKRKQHISNVKYSLAKLEQKTSFKIRREFLINNEQGELIFKVPKRELTKQELKYLNKKEELESKLEETYINQFVEFDKVKHFKYIHASFVTTGKNDIIESTDEYSSIKSDKAKQTEDYTKKALLGLSISAFMATLLSFTLMRVDDNWLLIVYYVFMKMLPLILQIVFAIDYVNTIMRIQKIPILRYRLNITNIYLATKEEEQIFIEKDLEEVEE